jgi:hypothetical protein
MKYFGNNKGKGYQETTSYGRFKIEVQDLRLTTLMRDIRLASHSFELLEFHHILMELNEKEDVMSKEVLLLPSRSFGVYKYFDGLETKAMEFHF